MQFFLRVQIDIITVFLVGFLRLFIIDIADEFEEQQRKIYCLYAPASMFVRRKTAEFHK